MERTIKADKQRGVRGYIFAETAESRDVSATALNYVRPRNYTADLAANQGSLARPFTLLNFRTQMPEEGLFSIIYFSVHIVMHFTYTSQLNVKIFHT